MQVLQCLRLRVVHAVMEEGAESVLKGRLVVIRDGDAIQTKGLEGLRREGWG